MRWPRQGHKAYLFLDEVQNLDNWSNQLKFSGGYLRRQGPYYRQLRPAHRKGGKDSLAGRIHTVEAGTLSLTEIGELRHLNHPDPFLPDNGLRHLSHVGFWQELVEHGRRHAEFRDQAFRHFSERGGYPLTHTTQADWPLLSDQLNETVIQRVIRHDLRLGSRGRRRDASLLEELFRLVCRYAGQAPSYDLLAREAGLSLSAKVGPQKARNYLRFLADTMLLHLIPPLELRRRRLQGSPKLCLVDHGLRGQLAPGAGSAGFGSAGGKPGTRHVGRLYRREYARFHGIRHPRSSPIACAWARNGS